MVELVRDERLIVAAMEKGAAAKDAVRRAVSGPEPERTFHGMNVCVRGEHPGRTWLQNALAERRAMRNWPKGYSRDVILTIEITDKCTLRCDHCFAEAGPENNTFIDAARVEGIARECEEIFPRYGERLIRITGGDPFLHPQMFEIIESFSGRKEKLGYYSLEVETNGWWARDAKTAAAYVARLKESRVDLLSMTMDYLHCKQGVFDIHEHFRTIERESDRAGLRFRDILAGGGSHHPDEKTARELAEHRKTCKACHGLPHVTPIGRAREMPEENWGSYELSGCCTRGCRLTPPTFISEVGDKYVHMDELTIGPNGNVYPCNSGKQFEHASLAMGNVYESPLRAIVENPDNELIDLLRTEGLRALTRRAGLSPRQHWALYWKMTPCGLCHEVLRTRGKEARGE
jgi:MoaA/NifB/PqqE/SkfB family radical SAM enzyme